MKSREERRRIWCNGRGEKCGGVSHEVVWSKRDCDGCMVLKTRTEQMQTQNSIGGEKKK